MSEELVKAEARSVTVDFPGWSGNAGLVIDREGFYTFACRWQPGKSMAEGTEYDFEGETLVLAKFIPSDYHPKMKRLYFRVKDD